jgi:hypothetical protein
MKKLADRTVPTKRKQAVVQGTANPVQAQPIRPIQEDGPNLSPRFAL